LKADRASPHNGPMIYLQMRAADHPFWLFAENRPELVPFGVSQLADGNRSPTNAQYARHVLAFLRRYYDDDEMPVEVVDYDGRPVAL
jgi:hypothetical protein